MTAGPIVCAACGAKLRSHRKKCLRCGAPVAGATGSGMGARSLTMLLGAAAAVALGGFAFIFFRGTPNEPVAAGHPVAAAPATPQPARGAVAAVSAVNAPAPAEVVVSANRDASAAYAQGDVARAIDDLTKAVAADPQNAMALNNLGQALARAGRAQDAIPYFDRAINLSDSTWAYHFNRARAYEDLKQWGLAIVDYRVAEQLFPDDYATAFNLAKALEANGSLPEAIDTFQRAITLAPGEADFHLAHGHALEEAGRPKDAAAAYRAYLDLEPQGRDADKIKARIAQLEGAVPPPAAQADSAAAAASTLAADRRAP